jgi:hypothetical protein
MFRFIEATTGKVAVGALLAAVLLVSVVSSGFGSGDNTRAVHSAGAGQLNHVHITAAAAATGGIGLVYVRGSKTVQPGRFFGAALTCPRTYHPISGFFDSNSVDTFMSTNRPDPPTVSAKNARKWEIGVTNTGNQPANVAAGIVCAR